MALPSRDVIEDLDDLIGEITKFKVESSFLKKKKNF